MIIRTNEELKRRYRELGAGDTVMGMVGFKHLRQDVLVDLLQRGVRLLPSALSQSLSQSKCAQAFCFEPWMLPHTLVIARRADMLSAINTYGEHGIEAVVTKEQHLHCGFGVHRWDSIETVYNQVCRGPNWYPFVIQPFVDGYTDVRVVAAGDYWEAYGRKNENSFRNNLSRGGKHEPYELEEKQIAFCRAVMQRGRFLFAHLDLLVSPDGRTYLSEIALNGGLKGAKIDRAALDGIKKDILERAAQTDPEGMRT